MHHANDVWLELELQISCLECVFLLLISVVVLQHALAQSQETIFALVAQGVLSIGGSRAEPHDVPCVGIGQKSCVQ